MQELSFKRNSISDTNIRLLVACGFSSGHTQFGLSQRRYVQGKKPQTKLIHILQFVTTIIL